MIDKFPPQPCDQSVTQDELHAFADDQLSEARREAVEAYLESHPEAARLVADTRQINALIRSAHDSVLDEPIPVRHVSLLQDRVLRRRAFPAFGAAAAGMLLGLGLGWMSYAQLFEGNHAVRDLASRTEAAYLVYAPETSHPVEVGGSDAAYLKDWLSNRMGMDFIVPRLTDLGFTLLGGRLMMGDETPAAMLMYENAQGRRLIFYIRNDLPERGRAAMTFQAKGGTGVLYWAEGPRGFGLSGGFSQKELTSVAQVVRAQLDV
jgi:anti-sigma factor RsiW